MSQNRMLRTLRLGLVIVGMIAVASGCSHSNLDLHWGESYQAQVVEQTENPDAPVNDEPPESLDPETANRVAERYYEGQEQQRQRQAPSIEIQP